MKEVILNLNKEWNEENMLAFIDMALKHLLIYDDEFSEGTYITDTRKVKIKWKTTGFACCNPFTGIIELNRSIFEHSFKPDSYGYKTEKAYIRRSCGDDKIKLLIWLLIHEYCHLFKDRLNHNHEFYKFIDNKFNKFLWYIIIKC